MPTRTRLDPVVKLREREETLAEEKLGKANELARRAEQQLAAAQAHAERDERVVASASHWHVIEMAQGRALAAVKAAQKQLEMAAHDVKKAQAAQATAFRRAEAVRRVAESKRQEIHTERAQKEARDFDEIASMLFWRQAG